MRTNVSLTLEDISVPVILFKKQAKPHQAPLTNNNSSRNKQLCLLLFFPIVIDLRHLY